MSSSERADLVTGAAGLVGANIVRALIERGRRVRALVREDTRALDGLDNVELVRGDLLDRESLERAVEATERVFHCAAAVSTSQAAFDLKVEQINHLGTRNLLHASRAAQVTRYIQVSSATALRPAQAGMLVNESSPAVLEGPAYARSKALADREVLEAAEEGFDARLIHPSGVIGPHDHKPSPIGRALTLAYRGLVPAVPRGGSHFIDARDLAQMAIRVAEQGHRGRRYIASDRHYSLTEILNFARRLAGRGIRPVAMPRRLTAGLLPLTRPIAARLGIELPFDADAIAHLSTQATLEHRGSWETLQLSPRPMIECIEGHFLWWRSTQAQR